MSQVNVERVIGRLATDEMARRHFSRNPREALRMMRENGVDLTPSECRSLAALDPGELNRFAGAIDPRLQKTDLEGGVS